MTVVRSSPIAQLHSSARLCKEPTHSEEAVKSEKHEDDIDKLAEKTSEKATQEFQRDNKNPSSSEEAVHADRYAKDPLPNEKKKSSSKPGV